MSDYVQPNKTYYKTVTRGLKTPIPVPKLSFYGFNSVFCLKMHASETYTKTSDKRSGSEKTTKCLWVMLLELVKRHPCIVEVLADPSFKLPEPHCIQHNLSEQEEKATAEAELDPKEVSFEGQTSIEIAVRAAWAVVKYVDESTEIRMADGKDNNHEAETPAWNPEWLKGDHDIVLLKKFAAALAFLRFTKHQLRRSDDDHGTCKGFVGPTFEARVKELSHAIASFDPKGHKRSKSDVTASNITNSVPNEGGAGDAENNAGGASEVVPGKLNASPDGYLSNSQPVAEKSEVSSQDLQNAMEIDAPNQSTEGASSSAGILGWFAKRLW